MTHRRLRPLLGALAAALLALSAAPAAQAAPDQVSIMMDDDLLLYRGDHTRDQALAAMKRLGVDSVRVTVLWEAVAENARLTRAEIARLPKRKRAAALRQTRRFRAANPRTYPRLNWDKYDRLVRKAQELGIRPLFNVTFPGPRWAHERAPASQRRSARTWKPKPREFQKFVKAVGTRYSGRFRDENDGRRRIPRVSVWSIGNEPNQGGWLTPQYGRTRSGALIPMSPSLYRELYLRGRMGLVQSGHGRDAILLGETAPLGLPKRSARDPIAPKRFLRELLCVDEAGQPMRGASARARDCEIFERLGPLRASGFAHHPYTKDRSPVQRDADPDAITMANIAELPALLDTLGGATGNLEPGLPIFLTEFGFETNPPDPVSGVSLDDQALWLQLGDFLAYLNPRVKGVTQFLLQDAQPIRRNPATGRRYSPTGKAFWFSYQSGLRYANGTPKPSAAAYSFPFLAYASGKHPETGAPQVVGWGQLRPLADREQAKVQLQWKPADGSADFQNVGEPLGVNTKGFFVGRVDRPGPGTWRAVWGLVPSRAIPVP